MSDQEDLDRLSRRLAATDFSADSRVRASLRARLLKRGPAASFAPAKAAALGLAFAAAALVLLLPLRDRFHRTGEELTATSVVPLPADRLPPARRTAYPRGPAGLPVLPGVLAETAGVPVVSPLSSRAVGALFETRRVTLDDIFETRRL